MLQSVEGGEARSQERAHGARVCGRAEVISLKSNGFEDEITGTSSPSFGSWSKEAFAWLPYSHLPAEIGSQFPAFMERHFIEPLTAMPSLLSEREEAFLLQMRREDPSSFHIPESSGPLHLGFWLVAGTPPPLCGMSFKWEDFPGQYWINLLWQLNWMPPSDKWVTRGKGKTLICRSELKKAILKIYIPLEK